MVDWYKWDIAGVHSQRPFGSLLLTDDLQLWVDICVNRCVKQAEAGRQGRSLCQLPERLLAVEQGSVLSEDLEELLIAVRLGCDYTLANALTEFSLGCFSEH